MQLYIIISVDVVHGARILIRVPTCWWGMASKNGPNRRVKTADTIFGIIELLDDLEEATGAEIADKMDMAPSTIHDHLMTLLDKEYIVKDGKLYRNSLKFLEIGHHSKKQIKLSSIVPEFLNQMVERTNEIAWFAIEEHGRLIYLNKARGNYAVQPYAELGERVDLHNIAAGKAILAHLPESRVREIIQKHGLKAYTENTITDPDELFEELATIREQGYAQNRDEAIDNFRAVASPIFLDGEVQGSIVLSGPKKRINGERFNADIPELVTGTANAIELEVQTDTVRP